MPDSEMRSVASAAANRPGRVANVVSILIVLVVALLLIWTALKPVPRFPYVQIHSEDPPIPRICTIVAANDQQRQRQLERCPPEALEDLVAEPAEDD